MEINKLQTREALIMLFGGPMMIAAIMLVSVGVGHWVTERHPTHDIQITSISPKPGNEEAVRPKTPTIAKAAARQERLCAREDDR
ncbi:MAG TPA: hypothetical protein VGP72_05165 [Planctomycetota bacterium]|jgi:hypothetical protein